MKTFNQTELLAPAGDLQKAYIALDYGADAIFLGAKSYSLRAHASNFEINDIKEIINYAHSKNKKVYLVTNIICHNALIKSAHEFIGQLVECNPDGFITSDPFIINLLKNNFHQKNIHISTQQSVCNSKASLFWKRNGANRIVLAREVSYQELKLLLKNLNHEIEIEVFIHGAVCISYSGRCTMSNNFSLRDANVGGCAQSCRWKYKIENNDIHQKDKYFTMSAKDMVQINNISNLLDLGIASFKIEGRMKSLHYIATVVNTYRKAMDNYYHNYDINFSLLTSEINNAANRETDTAWYFGSPDQTKMLYHDEQKIVNQNYAFIIMNHCNDFYEIQTKNKIYINQEIEIISPDLPSPLKTKITFMKDVDNNLIDVCPTPMTKLFIQLDTTITLNYPAIARILSTNITQTKIHD